MTEYVTVRVVNGIAVVTVDHPPVNALSVHVRKPLMEAFVRVRDDPKIRGLVLACAGPNFIAGADITEFGKPPLSPRLVDLIDTIDAFPKPTVSAIHGIALGGGLELSLAFHFRVARADARIGLPEVKLGLLPGAGGTVRLPRAVGPGKALFMIVTGEPISGRQALADGLVDDITDGDVTEFAISFANNAIAQGTPLRPLRERNEKIEMSDEERSAFDALAAQLLGRSRGLQAPADCVAAVRNTLAMTFDEARVEERRLFDALMAGEQSKAQRHLFFAERAAAKVEGVGRDTPARTLGRVGVIGAGTMGGGIAMSFLNSDIPVTLLELGEEALDRGIRTMEGNYDASIKRGSLTPEQKARRLELLSPTTQYGDLSDCDLIIEAVFEDMSVKKDVFGKLETIAKPGAILATNTSYLNVDEIAAATGRPQDVVGLHFFSPANVMRLLEIVRGKHTAPEVLATALATARRIGKIPVVVGVCHGFVGNRMLAARSANLEALLLEGATPSQVDKTFTDFGWPMGPFAMSDLAGLDIGWRNRQALGTKAVIADALYDLQRLGQKTGKGYYTYEARSRKPVPDPVVDSLIEAKARQSGINRREISEQEILERTLYPMLNEGLRVLDEGISARASDIDVIWVNGYGFPRDKGGPMYWADQTGWPRINQRLRYWYEKTGLETFRPAAK